MRKFARERVAPFARDYEEAKQYPSRLFEELASRGLMGMTAPEAVGGAGADYVSCALALIEIAAADGALSTILSIQNNLIVSALLKDGTPAQQAGFLPSLISRRMIGAFAARLRSVTPSVPRVRSSFQPWSMLLGFRGKRYGLQTMCEGGGIANVTIIEALG